jgi:uncharacterized LabA/DUF88 family protein
LLKKPDRTVSSSTSSGTENRAHPQPPYIAIFWDFQNVFLREISDIETTLNFIKQHGQIISARVYANWNTVLPPIARKLAELGLELIQISSPEENALDWKLTHDCIQYASTNPKPSEFYIIAGDADYGYLLSQLRPSKTVTVLARGAVTSRSLKNTSHRFIDINVLLNSQKNIKSQKGQSKLDINQAFQFLVKAIETAASRKKTPNIAYLGNLLRTVSNGHFTDVSSITSINHPRFKNLTAFLNYAAEQGIIRLINVNGQVIAELPSTPSTTLAENSISSPTSNS